MASAVKKIGVLTSGGDAPGMNAAIRAVVRSALAQGIEVVGVERGYAGLLNEEFRTLSATDVSDTLQRGGTILLTARCKEFMTSEGQDKGAEILKKHGIEGMVVIGGDGSYQGAIRLAERGINTVGMPGTIDLDISCTEYTIGFDTALNTAIEAIDKVRDTSSSHERCSIVEVMGRHAGYLALWAGISTGAEDVLLPETYDGDEQKIIDHVLASRSIGKHHHLIVNAEGVGDSMALAKRIEAATGMETRASILGHVQRGGSPTAMDRMTATLMGTKAVEVLMNGGSNRVICQQHGDIVDVDIHEALAMKKSLPETWLHAAQLMTR